MNSDRLIRRKVWTDEVVLCWHRSLKIDPRNSVASILNQLCKYQHFDYGESSAWPAIATHYGLKTRQSTGIIFPDWKVIARAIHERFGWAVLPIRYAEMYSDPVVRKLPSEISHKSSFYVY